jgi:hypothetical protein
MRKSFLSTELSTTLSIKNVFSYCDLASMFAGCMFTYFVKIVKFSTLDLGNYA